jgi:hypothetical protein
MHVDDVHQILSDSTRPMAARLLRLQGWRGAGASSSSGPGLRRDGEGLSEHGVR